MANTDESAGNGVESVRNLIQVANIRIRNRANHIAAVMNQLVTEREQTENGAEPVGNAVDYDYGDLPELVDGVDDEVTSAQWRKKRKVQGG